MSTNVEWMAKPQLNSESGFATNCPAGMEYLTQLDQVLMHQQVELFEAMTSIETNNRVVVKNSLGQQCYYAYEDTDFCMRYCCGPARGFTFHVIDNASVEVMRVTRRFKCCAGCCWCANADCCAFEVEITDSSGNLLGSVRQMQSCWIPHYDITDANGQTVLQIKGPCCICSGACCTCDFPFNILTLDGVEVGSITKQYSGCVKESFTNATNFGATFPKDLDVKIKGVILGATLLIDMMFFEHK